MAYCRWYRSVSSRDVPCGISSATPSELDMPPTMRSATAASGRCRTRIERGIRDQRVVEHITGLKCWIPISQNNNQERWKRRSGPLPSTPGATISVPSPGSRFSFICAMLIAGRHYRRGVSWPLRRLQEAMSCRPGLSGSYVVRATECRKIAEGTEYMGNFFWRSWLALRPHDAIGARWREGGL